MPVTQWLQSQISSWPVSEVFHRLKQGALNEVEQNLFIYDPSLAEMKKDSSYYIKLGKEATLVAIKVNTKTCTLNSATSCYMK